MKQKERIVFVAPDSDAAAAVVVAVFSTPGPDK